MCIAIIVHSLLFIVWIIKLHVFTLVIKISNLFLTEKPTEQSPLSCIFKDANVLFPDLNKIQESDKLELMRAVADIGNWLGLCQSLKIVKNTIEELKFSEKHLKYKKSDCLDAYFNKGEAAWEDVVLAVAQYPVNEVELARNIAHRYLHEPNLAIILKMLQSCN